MNNIIDSILLSGVTYTLSAQTSGGGNPTVELTQAEYDALVTAGTVSADTYYIITDAAPIDMSQYWTSAETQSAITQAVSGKQDTLTAGRAISISNNEVSLNLPISAGTGVNSIQEGLRTSASSYSHAEGLYTKTTADGAHAEGNSTSATSLAAHAEGYFSVASGQYSHAEGNATTAKGNYSHSEGFGTVASSTYSHAEGNVTTASGNSSHSEGFNTVAHNECCHAEGCNTSANGLYSHAEGHGTTSSGICSHAEGEYTIANNISEHASGQYNVSHKASSSFGDSGNTLFSVGNGTNTTPSGRHNAFEIRQNGDIYITSGSTDIKLQDNLGGVTIGDVQTMIDNSTSGKTDESAFTAHTADTLVHVTASDKFNWNAKADVSDIPTVTTAVTINSTDVVTSGGVYQQLGGMKIVKLTQDEYDALPSHDSSTIYFIVG